MICVMAVYPNHEGSRFDIDYYATRHAAFARTLLTPHGLQDIRIVTGAAALDGSPPPFWAVAEMRFTNRDAFDSAIARCGTELFADAPNYTDVAPILQSVSTDALSPAIQEH
jgi:uncharacterized protein (TIGR02118 family)